jgi:hypothetical protein
VEAKKEKTNKQTKAERELFLKEKTTFKELDYG